MTRRLRVATAVMLLLGFYGSAVAGVLLWLLVFGVALWGTMFTTGPFPVQMFVMCAATAPLAVALADAALRTVFHTTDTPEGEVLADDGQAAELCALVREVAADLRLEGRTPVIRFSVDANAGVIETDTRYLGLAAGNRCLVIGLPLLAVLTRSRLRAVLAHELAHFTLGHSRARALTLRLDTSLRIAADSVERMSQANRLVRQYNGLLCAWIGTYRRWARLLTRGARRRQEEEADREAVRLYGVDDLTGALRERAVAELAWPAFRDAFLDIKRGPAGRRPDNPFRVFAAMAASPEMKPGLDRLRERASSGHLHAACDAPHADLATRSRAAARAAAPSPSGGPAQDLPIGELLPDRLYENDLRRLMPEFDWADLVPWQDWTALVARRRAAELVTPLMKAVDDVGGGGDSTLTLGRVLAIIDAGDRMPLARSLQAHVPRELRRDDDPLALLATAVTALVSTLLVAECGATWRINWTGGATAAPADGTPPHEVRAWVEEAVFEPDRSTWLTFHLAPLGLPDGSAARRTPDRPADDGGTPAFVLGTVGSELPEEAKRLVSVLKYAGLSVIVGGILLGLGVSWSQGREWLRHDPTQGVHYDPGGGTVPIPTYGSSVDPYPYPYPNGTPSALESLLRDPLGDGGILPSLPPRPAVTDLFPNGMPTWATREPVSP